MNGEYSFILNPEQILCKFGFFVVKYNHSDLQYSVDIAEFLANFLRRIVKKMSEKLILEYNFKNKNSDDFYVLQLCFFDIFGFDYKK